MLTTIVLSLAVPGVAGVAWLALRGRLPKLAADTRGFALQTVLVMVVLLAIAGGVAAVLLNRGGDVITELENTNVSTKADKYGVKSLCEAAGFTWHTANSACSG